MVKRILVADDERHIVRLVQVNLERAGYEVIPTFQGKEALEQIALEKPDLVVLDVMMPYMDGFEVLQKIRANPATRDLPVIMLTSKAPDADVFRGWQSGVDCYLTKPFNPMELISFVKRIFSAQDEREANPEIPTSSPYIYAQPTPAQSSSAQAHSTQDTPPKRTPAQDSPTQAVWRWMQLMRRFF